MLSRQVCPPNCHKYNYSKHCSTILFTFYTTWSASKITFGMQVKYLAEVPKCNCSGYWYPKFTDNFFGNCSWYSTSGQPWSHFIKLWQFKGIKHDLGHQRIPNGWWTIIDEAIHDRYQSQPKYLQESIQFTIALRQMGNWGTQFHCGNLSRAMINK